MEMATTSATSAIKSRPTPDSTGCDLTMKTKKDKTGVTLVEMLVVLAIISILAGMVITIGTSIEDSTREKGVRDLFAMLEIALQEYREYRGDFPSVGGLPDDANYRSERLYAALRSEPASRKVLQEMSGTLIDNRFVNPDPAAEGPEIYDPWGTVLDYRYNISGSGQHFPTLVSAGPDKNFNTREDNITNKQ